jgi:hypothetical protein
MDTLSSNPIVRRLLIHPVPLHVKPRQQIQGDVAVEHQPKEVEGRDRACIKHGPGAICYDLRFFHPTAYCAFH